MELDMTKGNPFKLILNFMVPVLIGNVFQQLYNMADTIIVGRFVGIDALAAVGATGTINFLILGFAMGLTTGFTVITAQKYGAGDYDGVKRSVIGALVLSAITAVVITIISVKGMDWLLTTMNTPEDIYVMSRDYIITICLGMTFTILYNIMASLLRAVGNSRAPLYFLIISATINIVLDLVLIINFKMGVKGAALATVISQGISGILCVFYTYRTVKVLVPGKEHLKLDYNIMKNQLNVGLPMALQFSITAVGTIMVQAALNKFGSVVVASYTAANKAAMFATLPYTAIGVTMATYAAQNRGVNDIDRIKKGTRVASIMNVIYSIVAYGLIILLIPVLLKLFIDANADIPFDEILRYGRTYVVVLGSCYVALGTIFIYRNTLQGVGYSMVAMVGGVVELICRAIVATIASAKMNYIGVCAADPITWIVTGAYLLIMFSYAVKKMKAEKLDFQGKEAEA